MSHLWQARDADDPEASMILRRISALESELASLFLQLAGTDEQSNNPLVALRTGS